MPKMAEITEEWVEGFAKEAQSMGFTEEQTIELLKTAQHYMMMQDPDYAEGFNGELEKSAHGFAGLLGKGVMKSFPGWLTAVPALLGGQQLYKTFQRNWGVGPEDRLAKQVGEDLTSGALDASSARRRLQSLLEAQAKGLAAGTDGQYKSLQQMYDELKNKNKGGYYGNPYMY